MRNLFATAMAGLVLSGCQLGQPTEESIVRDCTASGLTPGTAEHQACVERLTRNAVLRTEAQRAQQRFQRNMTSNF